MIVPRARPIGMHPYAIGMNQSCAIEDNNLHFRETTIHLILLLNLRI